MDFFVDHAVGFALACAAVAVLYGLYLTWWLLKQPAGNEKMQEIARAIQEGAAAYLRKQYTTIAVVAIVPFFLLGFYNQLGWGTAFGFLIGAVFSALAGFIGMNVAVRSNVQDGRGRARGPATGVQGRVPRRLGDGPPRRRARAPRSRRLLLDAHRLDREQRRSPRFATSSGSRSAARSSPSSRVSAAASTRRPRTSAPTSSGRSRPASPRTTRATRRSSPTTSATTSGDCAGMAADLFETYAVTAVAVMLLGIGFGQEDLWLYPLALGGISILSSVIGTFFTRVGERTERDHQRPLPQRDRRDDPLGRSGSSR